MTWRGTKTTGEIAANLLVLEMLRPHEFGKKGQDELKIFGIPAPRHLVATRSKRKPQMSSTDSERAAVLRGLVNKWDGEGEQEYVKSLREFLVTAGT